MFGIFLLFCLYLDLLINLVFFERVETKSFFILGNYSSSKQILKIPFVDIGKWEAWAKFQQKLLNSVVAGARQSFQFFRQNIWFFENNRALSKIFLLHFALFN